MVPLVALVLVGLGGSIYGKPKDRPPAVALAALFGAFTIACLIAWYRAVRRRVHLYEWGVEDARSGEHLRWEDLEQILPLWTWGIRLVGDSDRRIEINKYMDGLGRLRESLATHVPELLAPAPVKSWIALHPLEFLPSLPGGTADPSRRLPEAEAGLPRTFEAIVDEVQEGPHIESSPRTLLQVTVTRGSLSLTDWIAAADLRIRERTYVLGIEGSFLRRDQAKEGDRVKLHLYEAGIPWLKPGATLSGRPL
jgi:hypothetical protein